MLARKNGSMCTTMTATEVGTFISMCLMTVAMEITRADMKSTERQPMIPPANIRKILIF
jgi:hypothetical protein